MDISTTVATWLNLGVTVVGLGSIVTQFSTILDLTDPFHTMRNTQQLGIWLHLQPKIPWYRIVQQPPFGPVLTASILTGLCGKRTVYLSRLPRVHPTGNAAWSVILTIIHPVAQIRKTQIVPEQKKSSIDRAVGETILTVTTEGFEDCLTGSWAKLPQLPLVKHKSSPCVLISRTCLIFLLCLTNAKRAFHYNSASGHRAAYPSYCGLWRVEWPIGGVARVYFDSLDGDSFPEDMYPAMFEQRVGKCLLMLAGVIDSQTSASFKCAFPGRKAHGKWVLQYASKAFGGARSGKGLYSQIGGQVHDVDFMRMKPMVEELDLAEDAVILQLPSKQSGLCEVTLYVPTEESDILNEALDKLPWTFMSWSVHRGLRDILIAFAKEKMNSFRTFLANTLRFVVAKWPERLERRGWDSHFVRDIMPDIAASAVLASHGSSGDTVRVVTDIALIFWDEGAAVSALDETHFWRDKTSTPSPILSPMTVIALVKVFVLEWSTELDYTLYHDLPLQMFLG